MTIRDTVLGALGTDLAMSRDQIVDELGLDARQVGNALDQLRTLGKCKRGADGWLRTDEPPPVAAKATKVCGTKAPNGHDIPTFAKAPKLEAPCGGKTSAHSAVNYRDVLADLVARREKLDAAISAVRAIVEAA